MNTPSPLQSKLVRYRNALVAASTALCIAVYLLLHFGHVPYERAPLFFTIGTGGLLLVAELTRKVYQGPDNSQANRPMPDDDLR